jgi:hypothetical protein
MHPLLPYYASFSLLALFGLELRTASQRFAVWLAAWGALGVVTLAAVFRPLDGDTGRYISAFEVIRLDTLPNALAQADGNHLFVLLNWLLGQLGNDPLWLIAPITLFLSFMLWRTIRQVLPARYAWICILLYSVYPYFVFYLASGIKQGLAMAMLLQGYILLQAKKWHASIWLGLAYLFHNGAALAFPFIGLHWLLWRTKFGYRKAFAFGLTLLAGTTILSITGLNEQLLSPLQNYFEFSDNYLIYFNDPSEVSYQAGFRIDFTMFSLLPLLAGLWLRGKGRHLSPAISGWWLNLYLLLACIYQLFSFVPFADRFAAFSWYLIPLILAIMLAEIGRLRELQIIVLIFSVANIFILQLYTGTALRVLI